MMIRADAALAALGNGFPQHAYMPLHLFTKPFHLCVAPSLLMRCNTRLCVLSSSPSQSFVSNMKCNSFRPCKVSKRHPHKRCRKCLHLQLKKLQSKSSVMLAECRSHGQHFWFHSKMQFIVKHIQETGIDNLTHKWKEWKRKLYLMWINEPDLFDKVSIGADES